MISESCVAMSKGFRRLDLIATKPLCRATRYVTPRARVSAVLSCVVRERLSLYSGRTVWLPARMLLLSQKNCGNNSRMLKGAANSL